ncbi:MAG: GNAT family N-acetyltransferase [Thermomicrobiales bacterium]
MTPPPAPVPTSSCHIEHRLPTPAEHRTIAEAVGWGHAFAWETMPQSLANSRLGAIAIVEGTVVGMGRVVGDGVAYWYIQDVAVLPAHQGAGIGQALVAALIDQIAARTPAPAFVGLFATVEGMPLYERLGFTPGDMQGMVRIVAPSTPE